jgi:hypothetical protein
MASVQRRFVGIPGVLVALLACQQASPNVPSDTAAQSSPTSAPCSPGDATCGEPVSPEVVAMFKTFEAAMNEHDLPKSLPLYAPRFVVADPHGTYFHTNDDARREVVKKESEYYRDTLGMTSTRIVPLSQVSMEGHHLFVRTVWECTFKKTGDRAIPFPLSFIIDATNPTSPKIVVHIVEKDEPQMFRDLGLL